MPFPIIIHCRPASGEQAVRGQGEPGPGRADGHAAAAQRADTGRAGRDGHAGGLLPPALPLCLRHQGPGPHLHGPHL